jgi:hypothetical protein
MSDDITKHWVDLIAETIRQMNPDYGWNRKGIAFHFADELRRQVCGFDYEKFIRVATEQDA